MNQLQVKGSPRKVDPRDPKSHPDYDKAVKAAKKRQPQMKFESDGQRLDYERQVRANPNNIPGLPVFYPPEKLRSSGFRSAPLTEEEKKQKEAWEKKLVTTGSTRLWCKRCRKETEHGIDMERSFCKKCGGEAPYHY